MAGFEDMMNGTAQRAGPAAAGDDGPPGAKPVTPELQQEYEKFVSMGLLMLFDEKTLSKTLDLLESSPNLIDTVAKVVSGVVVRLYAAARKQGEEITPEVVLHGGWEILTEVAALAVEAGIGELSEDDLETAFYIGADVTRQMMDKQGLIQPELDRPDEGVERLRAEVGDDGVRALMNRIEQARAQTANGLMAKARPNAPAGKEMAQ